LIDRPAFDDMGTPVLQLQNIQKRFPGVHALRGVSLEVHAGEVVALLGENGAGKSTLMKIAGGIERPDAGEVRIDGAAVAISDVHAAASHGIALIHQELNLLDNLDVAGNVLLGREPTRWGPMRLLDVPAMRDTVRPFLDQLGLDVSPDTPVASLSIARQQLVEIAKALSLDARVLIMDEPTSSLTLAETARLHTVVSDLRRRGAAIIYITHRLGEVQAIADRAVVLRDGANAGALGREALTHDNMIRLMVGRDIEVDRGEVFGIAGLVGAGRSELAQAIFGIDPPLGGTLVLDGAPLAIAGPADAIRHGVFLVPEDRRLAGLIVDLSIRENVSLPALHRYAHYGLVSEAQERERVGEVCTQLQVKTPSIEVRAATLSGGNQQKVVLAKWLALGPRVLIVDEPTRGIDVGAKAEIYRLLRALADDGVAILMISSDMEEILQVSDRVAVMHEGRITGVIDQADATEERIMALAVNQPVAP
jgi:ribose transport system ATP-binding protein